ncbi:MAG: beta-ketoacyl-ACP synthase 3 [Bacteroidales bacterium]|nr:beta-ketoacyl-ACP synthase 3 [Bacteroidales bacterium]
MTNIRAAITAVHGWLPDYVLNNEELSKMVDTTDEWILTRTGISERRVMKEPGKATSYMASNAVKGLIEKKGLNPEEIDLIIVATVTPDMIFPTTAALVAKEVGAKNAFGFDLNAACSGFLFGLETASQFIASGKYKKIILVGADMMSAITDYSNRKTCILFGDGAGAVLLEPCTDGNGVIDSDLHIDAVGAPFLYLKAGGSLHPATEETLKNGDHYVFLI